MIKKFMVFVFFICYLHNLNAAFKEIKKNEQALLQNKLLKVTRSIKAIKSDFKQTKYLSALSDKIISRGVFYYKQPSKIRWEYKRPFKYVIVFKSGKIFINDEGKVNKYDMNSNKKYKEINDLMVNCLQGTIIADKEKFIVSYFKDRKYILVSLKPLIKDMKGLISKINIYFEKRNYSVSRLRIIENSGDFTEIEFQKKNFDLFLGDDIFNINK